MKDNRLGFLISLFFVLNLFFGFNNIVLNRKLNTKVNEIFLAEGYRSADIVVNTDKVLGYLTPAYSSLAQGGEEMGVNMLAGTEGKIKNLKPEYIRLDHVFDDDYYGVYKDGKANFGELDKTVDSILAMGAKPFFSLGYMPGRIADNKIAKPQDYGKWQGLVEQTILHYSKDKGIDDVYYEVWNEPDLESFGAWKYYGKKNYLDLYDYSAKGAIEAKKKGAKDFKIGGPGITALYKNWVIALTKHCNDNKLPLDFISWHRYSYNPEVFGRDLEEIVSWLGKKDYELIISEWGPNPEKTNIYASDFAAAHMIATADKFIEKANFAFAFEVKDGPKQEKYGWGVLDYNKNPKPRYKAMQMASDMSGDYLEVSGEGSSISGWAIKDKNEIRVILTNYDEKVLEKENFPVKFTGLEEGNWGLSINSLKGKNDKEDFYVGSDGEYKVNLTIEEFDVMKLTLVKKKNEINSFSDMVKGEMNEKGSGLYFSDFE